VASGVGKSWSSCHHRAVLTTSESWTSRLWAAVEDIYAEIRRHPFLDGLTSGSLDTDVFGYYIVQDAHYLQAYARTLAVVGAKAPTSQDSAMFARHAVGALEVELSLHETLFEELGLEASILESTPVGPTTRAYASYLLATAYSGSFAEGLAAVLPCYWVYARIGAALVSQGSPDARYQRWIDTYADEAFATVVEEVLALADRTGPSLSADERSRANTHFVTTTRYEWMFWDAAWRKETWPP